MEAEALWRELRGSEQPPGPPQVPGQGDQSAPAGCGLWAVGAGPASSCGERREGIETLTTEKSFLRGAGELGLREVAQRGKPPPSAPPPPPRGSSRWPGTAPLLPPPQPSTLGCLPAAKPGGHRGSWGAPVLAPALLPTPAPCACVTPAAAGGGPRARTPAPMGETPVESCSWLAPGHPLTAGPGCWGGHLARTQQAMVCVSMSAECMPVGEQCGDKEIKAEVQGPHLGCPQQPRGPSFTQHRFCPLPIPLPTPLPPGAMPCRSALIPPLSPQGAAPRALGGTPS